MNLIHTHLLNKTEHSTGCVERPGFGLACADDCSTARFHAQLDEPLTSWERAAAERLEKRRLELLQGNIPA